MSSPEHKQKIWKMIKDIKVGMLVTLDHDMPRARPMHLVQDKPWMASLLPLMFDSAASPCAFAVSNDC